MTSPLPKCSALGLQCRSLKVTLRVTAPEGDTAQGDDEGTWLLGHTERLSYGELYKDDDDLYSDSVIHIPCRHLKGDPGGKARCAAYGFTGRMPRDRPRAEQPRRLGGDRFRIVEKGRMVTRTLQMPKPVRGGLPVLNGVNPCAEAPCRTADHTRKAACCRDLQVEVMCTRTETHLESLLRHRKAPYLCKVNRDGDYSVEAEVISACGYLGDDGVGCSLHGRVRPGGRPAKPGLCSDWPPKRQELHPGCVFAPKRRRG